MQQQPNIREITELKKRDAFLCKDGERSSYCVLLTDGFRRFIQSVNDTKGTTDVVIQSQGLTHVVTPSVQSPSTRRQFEETKDQDEADDDDVAGEVHVWLMVMAVTGESTDRMRDADVGGVSCAME